MNKTPLLLLTLVAFSACQKTEQNDLGYTISTTNCTTSEHHFSNEADYCAGLKDEALNNLCGYEDRRQLFTQHNCPGSFE